MKRLFGFGLLLAVVLSALPWEIAAEVGGPLSSAVVSWSDSPAPGPAETPCREMCLCSCCPAHSLTPGASDQAGGAQLFATGPLPLGSDTMHPTEFVDRVFHPPRSR